MLSDSLLRESSSSANVTPMPCSNAEELIAPNTVPSFLPGENEDMVPQGLAPTPSPDAATVSWHPHFSTEFFTTSTTALSCSPGRDPGPSSSPRSHFLGGNPGQSPHDLAPTSFSGLATMSPHLEFPTELWIMTLEYLRERKSQEELTYLWTTVRHVSRFFREKIEEIFMEEHMETTFLYADCCVFGTGRDSCRITCESSHSICVSFQQALFSFSHFDENNKERAIFKNNLPPVGSSLDETPFRGLCQKLGYGNGSPLVLDFQSAKRAGTEPGRGPEFGVYIPRRYEQIFVTQIRAGVNDTAMPAPRINVEKEEFSFEWKGLYTSFFTQQLATAKLESSGPHPVMQTSQEMDIRKSGKMWVARHNEPLRNIDAYLSWHLTEQIGEWKDIVSQKDHLDSSPFERLLQKRAADRKLYLGDDGGPQIEIKFGTESYPARRIVPVEWGPYKKERDHRRLRRIDRMKRGLVVPATPNMDGSAEACAP